MKSLLLTVRIERSLWNFVLSGSFLTISFSVWLALARETHVCRREGIFKSKMAKSTCKTTFNDAIPGPVPPSRPSGLRAILYLNGDDILTPLTAHAIVYISRRLLHIPWARSCRTATLGNKQIDGINPEREAYFLTIFSEGGYWWIGLIRCVKTGGGRGLFRNRFVWKMGICYPEIRPLCYTDHKIREIRSTASFIRIWQCHFDLFFFNISSHWKSIVSFIKR